MKNEELVKALKIEAIQLEERLSAIKLTISTLERFGNVSTITKVEYNNDAVERSVMVDLYPGYEVNSSYAQKIMCILKKENRFLHIREITNIIGELEG
jgi:hypothetical protein